MTENHTPTTNDNTIIRRTHANYRLLLELQQTRYPHVAEDIFMAAMTDLATALRKSKRASKRERRSA